MNRSHLVAIAAVAALAFPAAALAADDTALDAFQKICGNTGNDYPEAVKAADADGWHDTEVIADTMKNVSITDKASRAKGEGDTEVRLMVTRGLEQLKPGDMITVSTCTVSTDKGTDGMLDRVKAWLGEPSSTDTGEASYLLTLDGKKLKPLASADVEGAVAKGGVHVMKFKQNGSAESLDYVRLSQ
jgi:hypothetical protein